MITVRVGGCEFTSDPSSGWGLAELQGWEGSTPSKSDVRERPQADGAHGLAKFYRSSRVITFNGLLTASTPAESKAQRRAGAAIQADGRPSLMEVTEDGETLSAVVEKRFDEFDERPTDVSCRYVMQFVARDDRKYGPSVSVSTGLPTAGGGIEFPIDFDGGIDFGIPGDSGRVTTENPGDRDTYSLLEVTGGLSGFELTCIQTGQVLRLEREVPLDSTVFLNPRTGRAYIDSPANDVSGFLTRREWWSVPAGGSREIQFVSLGGASGTPTLTARTAPAY